MLDAQLGGFAYVTSNNCVVVGCYECNIIVCIYNISPVTADTMPDVATYLYYACRSCFGPAALACVILTDV